ncbi:hypothetical protein H8D79_00295, partial [PVC group bacterium]|nr:hypothetical protein [PVC group bacterium]
MNRRRADVWISSLALALTCGVGWPQETQPLVTRKKGQKLPFVLTAAVRTRTAPVVDGRLDDACWRRGAIAGDFVLYGGKGYASEQTDARVLWDDSALYIAMRCFDSDIAQLKRTTTKDGGRVFMDDCIEVFCTPVASSLLTNAPDGERYFHLCVNAAGARYDEIGYEAPKRWTGEWIAKTSVHHDRWEVELALPWGDLGTKPKDGAVWAINFNRGLPARGNRREYSGWSITFSGFHDPEHFGKMIFLSPPPELGAIGPELSARLVRNSELDPLLDRASSITKDAGAKLRALSTRAQLPTIADALAVANRLTAQATALRESLAEMPPAGVIDTWEQLRTRYQKLVREAEGLSAKAGFCAGLRPAQLSGREPIPDFLTFILPAITNERVLPRSLPTHVLPGHTIKLVACPGEYESGSVGIYALADLPRVRLTASDLEGPAGAIPASGLDLRTVKVWYQGGRNVGFQNVKTLTPELLLKNDGLVQIDEEQQTNILAMDMDAMRDADALQPFAVPKGTAKQLWVTVHVPARAPAGTYRGRVRIEPASGAPAQVPVELRVLPFGLDEPKIICSIYYRGTLGATTPKCTSERKTVQQVLAEFRDMVAHGVTNPTVYQRPGSNLLRYFGLRREAGLHGGPLLTLGVGAHASLAELRKTVAFAKDNGFSAAYFYAADERKGDELRAERRLFRTIHEAGGKVFVACYRDSYELVGDLLDLPIYSGKPDVEIGRAFHSMGHLIGSYGNPQGGVEEPETYRRNFGLALWKAGYDCACTYAYQHSFGHAWDDFDHATYRDHNMAYPTVDGVIPTIQWEGYREGYDDLRYLATLQDAIEAAKGRDGPAGALARAAELWVLRMDPDETPLDELRRGMIERILTLRQALD